MVNSSTPFLALKMSLVHSTISSPYITSNIIPVVNAVCHENREDNICFHTGVPFCPVFIRSSYSLRARATSSAKTGRLLLIAIKNICGPIANDGISRAICWILLCKPLNLRSACGNCGGTTSVSEDTVCRRFNSASRASICFSRASIWAIFSL